MSESGLDRKQRTFDVKGDRALRQASRSTAVSTRRPDCGLRPATAR